MRTQPRAVVIGAGFAGEGHARALRHSGVAVSAICARQPRVVRAVADRLGIPEASTDWHRTLERTRPDIVALATPASLRGEVIAVAAELGCHVFCDKPLAARADEAQRLFHLVERAGVKHAYAATQCYDPGLAWLAEMVHGGAIGPVREIAYSVRFGVPLLSPWGWWDLCAAGGGSLNLWGTHVLSVLKALTGGDVLRVMGAARPGRRRAPVVPGIHDYRALLSGEKTPTAGQAEHLEWRTCDADGSFAALLTCRSAAGEVLADARVSDIDIVPWPPDGWRLYGDAGTLLAEGDWTGFNVSLLCHPDATREPLPVPQRLVDAIPQLGDAAYNNWAALAHDFVADIRGEPHRPYLTFRDGWLFQEALEAIRCGRGWYELPL